MNLQEHVSLREMTTFDIGGPARYFVAVRTLTELQEALAFAAEQKIPFFVLAGGSNVLVSDNGFSGLIIKMAMDEIVVKETAITVGAGADLRALLLSAAHNNLSGGENLAGVPGSVGGAVRGNAGAFGTEIGDLIERVHVYDRDTKEEKEFGRELCRYGYRTSIFKEDDRYIILRATFRFVQGHRHDIEDAMHDIIAARNKKHIQQIKSAGSFFINPLVPEDIQKRFYDDKGAEAKNGRVPAGWLLERAGLDQKHIGGIQAGAMHANYFINIGEGTAEQALQLASLAKTRVRDEFGVQLKEEVQLVGF